MYNTEDYSHLAFLDELSIQLRNDVLVFLNTEELSEDLNLALMNNRELRENIQYYLDEQFRKYNRTSK